MPRPVRIVPLSIFFGDGRGSQPYASAAALTTAIERARLKPLSSVVAPVSRRIRNSIGSALAAAALSSMNDSGREGTFGPLGSRRLPVRIGVSQTRGRLTTCDPVRLFGISYMSDGVPALPAARGARAGPPPRARRAA